MRTITPGLQTFTSFVTLPGSYPGRSTGNPPPAFALDTAYLGGMYAGHIFIIGTEDGLGSIGGDYNPRYGRVTGGHSLLTNDVRIIEEISPPDIHGVYEAIVEIKTPDGNWVEKLSASGKPLKNSMFPKDWDAAKIQTEIESAWAVKSIDPNKTNAWVGTSKSGLEIGGYLDPRTTAFPIYERRK